MANSVDPDETAHYERSHLDLHCLQRYQCWPAGMKGFIPSMLGNNFGRQHRQIFFLFFPGSKAFTCPANCIIISSGDNLHGISKIIFWEKNIINLSSAEFAQRVVRGNV